MRFVKWVKIFNFKSEYGIEEHPTKYRRGAPQTCQVVRNKESRKSCHSQEEPKETWQLNIMWFPGEDARTEIGHK